MTATNRLPGQFNELERFVNEWAFDTENKRTGKRWASTSEQFQTFYDAMVPRIEEILAYLDGFPIDDLPEDVLPLFHLALALAEVAPHVEFYKGAAKVPHSFDASRMIATRGDAPDPNHSLDPAELAAFKPQAP
jgi:hypothetical protein